MVLDKRYKTIYTKECGNPFCKKEFQTHRWNAVFHCTKCATDMNKIMYPPVIRQKFTMSERIKLVEKDYLK